MNRLLGHSLSSAILRWVLTAHIAAVVALMVSAWIREWLKPELDVIPVSMIELPADMPETMTDDTEVTDPPQAQPDPPPQQRLRTPEEIRQSALRPVTRPPRPENPPQQPRPSVDIDTTSMTKRLRQAVDAVNVTITLPSGSSGQISADQLQKYLSAISGVLHRAWEQPSSSSVPANQRTTKVRLIVSENGDIVNAAIAQTSGNAVMDQSVLAIFDRQSRLPAPNRYGIKEKRFTVTIAFELESR